MGFVHTVFMIAGAYVFADYAISRRYWEYKLHKEEKEGHHEC
jgi:hypothetical protein